MPSTVAREKASSPYKLRDTSKLPSRYRDEEIDVPPLRARTPAKARTPSKISGPPSSTSSSARRVLHTGATTPSQHSLHTPGPLQENVSHSNSASSRRSGELGGIQKIEVHGVEGKHAVVPLSLVNPGEVSVTSFASNRGDVNEVHAGSYVAPTVVTRHSSYQQHPRVVYARLRAPKDGIYGGTIDALVSGGGGYRIVFDKKYSLQEDMIPPAFVPDYEVMYDGSLELLSLSYFLQQNSARLPTMNSTRTGEHMLYEKVGNFPVRMLVILVKVAKLLEIKKKLVKTLTELNNEAEKESILTDVYTAVFQERYARTVVDLETVNRQVNIYLNGIQEYNTQLLPHLSEVSISARPEALRRMCASHANQIVKHCNQSLNVTNPQALRLITALTSLLLQVCVMV
ncbi:hypothetical protein OSTOST_12106 [Ostertagia ostertagi]